MDIIGNLFIDFSLEICGSELLFGEVSKLGNSESVSLGFVGVVGLNFEEIHEENRFSIFLFFSGHVELAELGFEVLELFEFGVGGFEAEDGAHGHKSH